MFVGPNGEWVRPFRAGDIGVGRIQGVALGSVWLRAFGPADQTALEGGNARRGLFAGLWPV